MDHLGEGVEKLFRVLRVERHGRSDFQHVAVAASTPALNRPNVFMIGPSPPVERLRWSREEYLSASILPISYTFDHRAIDGKSTARFLSALNEVLEEPELMLA